MPHRIQFLRTLDGLDYFNDSKSTSPSATIVALESFDRAIVAIVGGQKKDVRLTDFAEALIRSCRAVVYTGESGSAFAEAVRNAAATATGTRPTVMNTAVGRLTHPLVHRADRMEDAVRLAQHEAQPDDVLLFSPGAPSFDSYSNFAQRGDHFMKCVLRL